MTQTDITARRAAMRAGIALALEQAADDYRAGVSEADRSEGGRLDTMFRVSGWSPAGGVAGEAHHGVRDWCGMAVISWLLAGGFNEHFNTSFLHVWNIEAFFTYGARKMVNPRRYDSHAVVDGKEVLIGSWHRAAKTTRRWLDREQIRAGLASPEPNPDLFAPGDILVIDWSGVNASDHVALIRDWDPVTRILRTYEGNRTGVSVDGAKATDAVVPQRYDLTTAADRRIIYGVGRTSPLDWGAEEAR